MDTQSLSAFIMNNLMYIIAGMGVLLIVMYAIIIHLWINLSSMKKLYREMMTGVNGANLEEKMIACLKDTKAVAEDNTSLREEIQRIDALLQTSLTRVGVVRFAAFEDMGSDLSYAVAMLDSHNNGVVFSSIFGREDSRSYVKPIRNGNSTYTLSEEEKQAIREAMNTSN